MQPRRQGPAHSLALILAHGTSLLLASCTGSAPASLSQGGDGAQALEAGTGGPSRIRSVLDSSRCVAANSANNGEGLTLTDCSDSKALAYSLTGVGQLRLGSKCLDVSDGKASNGALVQLWDCFDDNTNQRWRFENGLMTWAGHALCLDIKDGKVGPGATLQIWACDASNRNQQWTLQAATTPSGTVPPTPTPTAPPSTGDSMSRASCKRGLSADAGAALSLKAQDLSAISPNVTWWYNWYLRAGDASVVAANSQNDLDYVQMVSVRDTDFNALAANLPPKAKYLLTFNEPNFHSQSNIPPEEAAALWPRIQAFADQHNLLIVSPALNYCWSECNVQDPFEWFDRFFAACPGCRVDHIAVHAYTCDVPTLRSMSIDPFWKKYNRPIWLTEFDCADSGTIRNDVAAQKAYMTDVVASLEADPHVFRYAWFMAKADGAWSQISLLDSNGRLTELGRHYLSLPQACKP